jgi:hypothetical protein
METRDELKRMCENIATDLKDLYDADYTEEEIEELEENGEPTSLWNYFDDCLDIEYTISSRGEYRGCRIMVTWGGPNIWVDTTRGEVFGAWWTDTATAWIPSEVCNEIDLIFEEYYNCIK